MRERYPPIEPYDAGLLDVGDGNQVYWEVCGNPAGKPALVVHGGPGSGAGEGHRRFFDPQRYRVVLFDQRGCGRSTPHASDPDTDMSVNTTHHLIADMERLREHLGIGRWLLYGGSWGSTLILAYGERFTERGEDPDAAVRERAASDWLAWEDAVISLEPNGTPNAYSDRPPAAALAFVRICAHYFSHDAWLEDGELLRNAGRLAGIPGILFHGRLDLGSPLGTAWALAQAWPGSELRVVDDSGHTGSDAMRGAILETLERFGA